MKKSTALIAACLLALGACSDDGASAQNDAGLQDAGPQDTSDQDTSNQDAGVQDASDQDTSDQDTSNQDASNQDTGNQDTGQQNDPLACPALPASGGTEVHVDPSQAGQLPNLVYNAEPNTTFILGDGTYKPGQPLHIVSEGLTIRSASDDATKVIIDGEYSVTEPIFINASNVTIAHLTVTRAVDHPIHVTPGGSGSNITGTHLYGLRLIDGGEQFVKINPNGDRSAFVDDGRIECSYFEMTDAGRPHVERNPGGCYTGGVDAHGARGWVVRNNEFHDIYCAGEGLAEHAVHFWSASRDTVVENNRIINCARGVGFGLVENGGTRDYADDPYPNAGYIGHYDGVIRNNVIYADKQWFDTGVELDQARGAKVYHNTVYKTDSATGFYSSIDYRFANTDVEIRNNLVNRITSRNGANGTVDHNVEGIDASYFADAGALDFHLSAGASDAIDQGAAVEESGVDIDGETHDKGGGPDIGADER